MNELKFMDVNGVRHRIVDADVLADVTHMQERIADLEKQLAEKDKEIERMRPFIVAMNRIAHGQEQHGMTTGPMRMHNVVGIAVDVLREYEQPTKPDGGDET